MSISSDLIFIIIPRWQINANTISALTNKTLEIRDRRNHFSLLTIARTLIMLRKLNPKIGELVRLLRRQSFGHLSGSLSSKLKPQWLYNLGWWIESPDPIDHTSTAWASTWWCPLRTAEDFNVSNCASEKIYVLCWKSRIWVWQLELNFGFDSCLTNWLVDWQTECVVQLCWLLWFSSAESAKLSPVSVPAPIIGVPLFIY